MAKTVLTENQLFEQINLPKEQLEEIIGYHTAKDFREAISNIIFGLMGHANEIDLAPFSEDTFLLHKLYKLMEALEKQENKRFR